MALQQPYDAHSLDTISLPEALVEDLRRKGVNTLERLLGVMTAAPEAFSRGLFPKYNVTYDSVIDMIRDKLPVDKFAELTQTPVPRYPMGALPKKE